MNIRTLNLKEAANFLKMTPEGLRRKAASGEVPGAKPGKRWCFREDDLADYLRTLYANPAKVSWGASSNNRREKWHSTKEVTHGGLVSATLESEYKKALGLPIK